jgi:hypothetical protein
MKKLTMNHTPNARKAAALIGEHCSGSHRGAMRYPPADTEETFCVALFGNDGYTQHRDGDSVIDARTKAYVHNLYAGLANLLPEGAVEFGTDEDGYAWVILSHFPRNEGRDDNSDDNSNDKSNDKSDDDQDDDSNDDALTEFWNDIVWVQWKSQLSFTEE